MKSLKKQNVNLGDNITRDTDPEALETFAPSPDSDTELESEDGAFTGREHYKVVGKSKLRKAPQPELGKEYEGSTVSRAALNGGDNDEDDPLAPIEEDSDEGPFAKSAADSEGSSDSDGNDELDAEMAIVDGEVEEGEDEEIDSDEAFGDEDVAKFRSFKFPGSKSAQLLKTKTKTDRAAAPVDSDDDHTDGDSQSEDLDGQLSEEDDLESDENANMDDDDVSSMGEDSDDDSASTISTSPETLAASTAVSSDRAALKAILANDAAAVASTLSAAADADAKKGKAVKQQYQIFDRLLDARIKLQKGLTVANNLTQDFVTEFENDLSIQKAEEATLSLWSTIESIRHSMLNAQLSSNGSADKSKKRKRPAPAITTTSTPDLWSRTQSVETQSLPHHRAVLDKWSSKARAATALPTPRSQLIDRSSQNQNKITAVLDTYLASESDKLIAQASNNPTSTSQPQPPLAYDDTSFYQSLLRDLIASRSSTSSTTLSNTAILPSMTRLHPHGSKNKRVHTKASKGRKVRYTVHEKLQNFAAEEKRGTWEESARREFFGSLFGKRGALDENENDGEGEDDGVVDGEKEALRFFRN